MKKNHATFLLFAVASFAVTAFAGSGPLKSTTKIFGVLSNIQYEECLSVPCAPATATLKESNGLTIIVKAQAGSQADTFMKTAGRGSAPKQVSVVGALNTDAQFSANSINKAMSGAY